MGEDEAAAVDVEALDERPSPVDETLPDGEGVFVPAVLGRPGALDVAGAMLEELAHQFFMNARATPPTPR